MKRLYIILLMALCYTVAQAQSLRAYHVVGKVTRTVNGQKKDVVMNDVITQETQVSVPFEGKLELLDEKNSKRIIIQTPGTGTVKALSAASGNSVLALSERYVAYVKKQMTNKGLVSKQRYTDFATVTRSRDSIADTEPQPMGFAAAFNSFKNQTRKKFDSFRDSCNQVFISHVRNAWVEMGMTPPVPKPQKRQVKPIVLEGDPQLATNSMQTFEPSAVAEAASAKDASSAEPVEAIPEAKESFDDKMYASMPFSFYGTEMSVRLDESRRINVGKINPDRVADLLERLSTKEYDNVLYDCLKLRKQHNLCDWAYLLMLKEISDQFCGAKSNEAALLMGYLMYQSGFKVKFAHNANRLYLLVASKHQIYDKSSYGIDNDFYYPVEEVQGNLFICDANFPKEQGLSLFISQPQLFTNSTDEPRVIKSRRYRDLEIEVAVNKNLMEFYNTYPSSCINDDYTTRWIMYAETPLNENVKQQIYPALKENLEDRDPLECVQRLLNLVQTGLEYKYDEEVWGQDRAFFAEESLFYPYCDCEDRAVLFTRLVRDLVGLECVLVEYPGHLAAAVHFPEEVPGDAYVLNGKSFTVCDPTFINAKVGMQMPNCAGQTANLIPIK